MRKGNSDGMKDRERLFSLDVLRGLDMLFLCVVHPIVMACARTWGAIFFNGGYAFTCEDNVFVDCYAGATTPRPEEWCNDACWKKHLKGLERRLLEEVCVTGALYQARYP